MEGRDELLRKLEDFFCGPKFTCAIGDFISQKAGELEFRPLDEEQPFRNFDIYKEYTSIVERQLEEFILSEGLTVKDVCEACAAAQETHVHMSAIDYLLASTEYESFMQLAYDHHSMGMYDPDELTAWAAEEGGGEQVEGQA